MEAVLAFETLHPRFGVHPFGPPHLWQSISHASPKACCAHAAQTSGKSRFIRRTSTPHGGSRGGAGARRFASSPLPRAGRLCLGLERPLHRADMLLDQVAGNVSDNDPLSPPGEQAPSLGSLILGNPRPRLIFGRYKKLHQPLAHGSESHPGGWSTAAPAAGSWRRSHPFQPGDSV